MKEIIIGTILFLFSWLFAEASLNSGITLWYHMMSYLTGLGGSVMVVIGLIKILK